MNSKKLISNGPKETEEMGEKLSNFILQLKEPGGMIYHAFMMIIILIN